MKDKELYSKLLGLKKPWEITHSGLKPLISVAKMFNAYLTHLVYFLTHRSPIPFPKGSTVKSNRLNQQRVDSGTFTITELRSCFIIVV